MRSRGRRFRLQAAEHAHRLRFRRCRRCARFALRIDAPSWLAIVICIGAVMAAETANTAIEAVVDLVSPEYHVLAKHAKDCAAGAALILAAASVVVAAIVFIPKIGELLC